MLLTVQQVAERCQVDQEQVLAWIHSKQLRATSVAKKPGGRPLWRIRPGDLESFLDDRTPDAAPKLQRRAGRLVIPKIARARA